MFTGIIEQMATIRQVEKVGTNRRFTVQGSFSEPIKVDQSIAHDGVCLTVEEIHGQLSDEVSYTLSAVQETLEKTALGDWEVGRLVNLERAMQAGARLDGHFVQGHVDATGEVIQIQERAGSWMVHFRYPETFRHLMVPKGSICINGVSLTVVDCPDNLFTVTIIPYTWEHTNFHQLKIGDKVNLEFDILGKYLARMLETRGVISNS